MPGLALTPLSLVNSPTYGAAAAAAGVVFLREARMVGGIPRATTARALLCKVDLQLNSITKKNKKDKIELLSPTLVKSTDVRSTSL